MLLPVLDIYTAFGMVALSAWTLLGVLWLLGRRFWAQGVPYVMAAAFCFGVAYWLFAIQKSLPPAWAMTGAHLCISVAIALLAIGYQRFRGQQWSLTDAITLGLPLLLLFAGMVAAPSDMSMQVRLRGVLFIGQLLWQLHVLLRATRGSASLGWKLVVAGLLVQILALMPLVIYGERQFVPAANMGIKLLLPWMTSMVMFLNLQITAYGYLRMLQDRQHEAERKAAGLDGLTQLPSRRTLMEHVPTAMALAEKEGSSLGLLVLDIDHFKKVNDRYGHVAGDAVIQHVAWVLRNQIREQDFPARYGGEEFVVLLPQATSDIVYSTAQRIAHAVHAEVVAHDDERIRVSVSLGGHLQKVHAGLCWEEMLAVADAALYEAKNTGRDRVVLSAAARAQVMASPSPAACSTSQQCGNG